MTIHLPAVGPDLPIHPLPHPHTGQPVRALGLRRNGAPIWPSIGASEDDTGGGDGGDGDGDGQGDDAGDGKGDDDLGDAGKKALDAMKDQRNKAKADLRPWSALARELGLKTPDEVKALLAKAKGGDQGDGQPDADKIKADARAEATAAANARIIRSEVKAAAGGKLADPNDAVRLLDLTQFEVDDDGEVDEDAIAEAIDDLVKKKPYLASDPKKRFQGGGDGGSRGDEKTEPGTGKLRLNAAYAASKSK